MVRKSSLFDFLRKVTDNEKVRFLFFMERSPKHRVAERVPTGFVVSLPLIAILAWVTTFWLFQFIGFFGMIGFMIAVMLLTLEICHCIFDR